MFKYLIIAILLLPLVSCNKVKNKAKSAINKTGQAIGESSSEFIDGVSKGVKSKYKCEIIFIDSLKYKDLESGSYEILSSDSATDNILSLYLIYNSDIDTNALVKVFNKEGIEYGRTKFRLKGKKDEAAYYDIAFDKRVNIDELSRFEFE